MPDESPPTKEELGRRAWTLLHTMASNFPDKPTIEQSEKAEKFIELVGDLYPCSECADHFRELIEKHPPRTESRKEFSQWMCEAHNIVNERLGKPTFDCSVVDERWKVNGYTKKEILNWEF